MNEYLKYCLSDKNRALWNQLNQECDITIKPSDEPNFKVNTLNDVYTIYVLDVKDADASFTHELLHIEIKHRGIKFSKYFENKTRENVSLLLLFRLELLEHVTNCLEHSKLINEFVDLGYSRNLYLQNYNSKMVKKRDVEFLKSSFKTKEGHHTLSIDAFIGHSIAMLFDVNPKNNYNNEFRFLKSIDSVLFKHILAFKNDWDTYDINDPNDDYEEIIDFFIDDLTSWASNKTLV